MAGRVIINFDVDNKGMFVKSEEKENLFIIHMLVKVPCVKVQYLVISTKSRDI